VIPRLIEQTTPAELALPVESDGSTTPLRSIAQTTGDRVAPRRSQRRRIVVAGVGIALAGLGVVLAVSRERVDTDPPGMVRFEPADIHMVAQPDEARPDGCTKLLVEGDCKQLLFTDAIKHVGGFVLDSKEVTNEDFYAWLNAHRNHWLPIEEDGIVWEQVGDTKLPLIWTKPCLDSAVSLVGGASPIADGAQTTATSSKLPVTCVTWYGATRYCRDQGKRLPLESEWQLAAKGVAGRSFPWGGDPLRPNVVAYELHRPRAVGTSSLDVSPENIYDLAGNAAEWVQSEAADPDFQIVRGGSFSSKGACPLLGSKCARVHWRGFFGRNVGFRCARDVAQ
jgi:formylglycine-generating enzyme required for sulfatase activity